MLLLKSGSATNLNLSSLPAITLCVSQGKDPHLIKRAHLATTFVGVAFHAKATHQHLAGKVVVHVVEVSTFEQMDKPRRGHGNQLLSG